jgi:hypothetical protein
VITEFVTHYSSVRLHSAIGFVTRTTSSRLRTRDLARARAQTRAGA